MRFIAIVAAHYTRRFVPKQLLMKHLVKASVHLLLTEAIVWYGSQKEIKEKEGVQSLVTYFCSRVKEAFDPTPLVSMRRSFWDDGTPVYRLAKDILSGESGMARRWHHQNAAILSPLSAFVLQSALATALSFFLNS
jgi:hypothetical protein